MYYWFDEFKLYLGRIYLNLLNFQTCMFSHKGVCIHPKIPQLAVIEYSESIAKMYTSDIRAKWLACFLDGGFSGDAEWCPVHEDIYSGRYFRRSSILILHTWYNDQLCRDMRCNLRRKKGFFSKLFDAYSPGGYANLLFKSSPRNNRNLVLRPCLDTPKNPKLYKILHHIESYGTCMKY